MLSFKFVRKLAKVSHLFLLFQIDYITIESCLSSVFENLFMVKIHKYIEGTCAVDNVFLYIIYIYIYYLSMQVRRTRRKTLKSMVSKAFLIIIKSVWLGIQFFRKGWRKRSGVFLHFFQNVDFIRFKKYPLKVCSQKFVETIDNDKPICYNKAKLRDRNKKTKKLKMNIKNRQNKEKTNKLDKKRNKTIFYDSK